MLVRQVVRLTDQDGIHVCLCGVSGVLGVAAM
jgi:hypothetical protein